VVLAIFWNQLLVTWTGGDGHHDLCGDAEKASGVALYKVTIDKKAADKKATGKKVISKRFWAR